MPRILLIETSTSLCSVSLGSEQGILGSRQTDQPRAHAAMTAPFVKELLDSCSMRLSDCDAVCVSSGPGSYTGLRVGVSTAKGLCFAGKLPLMSVNTLDILACQAIEENLLPSGCNYIVPMIDARRMEVYCAAYSTAAKRLSPIESRVIEGDSFSERLCEGPVLFIGDGAGKCSRTLESPNAVFVQTNPNASAMLSSALCAFNEKRFEDVAYFEPFYLKDFVATQSKKKLF